MNSYPNKSQIEAFTANFVQGKFLYNTRILLCLIPCFLVILAVTNAKMLIVTIIFGFTTGYLLRNTGRGQGPIVCLWITLGIIEAEVMVFGVKLLNQSIFNGFLLLSIGPFLLFTGIFLSLQFSWVLLNTSPYILLMMERILLGTLFLPTSIIITWGAIKTSGIENAPLYLLTVLCITYYLLGIPLQSSFRVKTHIRDPAGFATLKIERAIHTVAIIVLPSLLYIVIHFKNFGFIAASSNVVILYTLGATFIILLVRKGSLAWLGLDEHLHTFTNSIAIICSILLVACFEYKVIFVSLYHFIPIPPPWNYIWTTISLYSFLGLAIAHFTGTFRILGNNIVTAICGLGTLGTGIVIGMPWYLYPFPLLLAYQFTQFYNRRRLQDYVIFVVLTWLFLLWFLHNKLNYLHFSFQWYSISLSTLNYLLEALFLLSFLLPGLLIFNRLEGLTNFTLLCYTLGITLVEQILYQQNQNLYPGFLILFTTALGSYLTVKLHQEGKIKDLISWMIICIYLSKLSLLLYPLPMAIPASLFLLGTITPLFLYSSSNMTKQQGIIHCLAIGIACFVTRHSVPARLLQLIIHSNPSEQLILALFIILWGVFCLPLSFHFFSHYNQLKNINVFVMMSGTVIFLMQPEINLLQFTKGQCYWCNWMGLLALLISICCLFSIIPFSSSPTARVAYTVSMAVCIGIYVSEVYLESRTFGELEVLMILILLLAIGILVFTPYPAKNTNSNMPYIYVLFIALLPFSFYVMPQIKSVVFRINQRELLANRREVLLGLYATLNILIALEFKFLSDSNLRKKRVVEKKDINHLKWLPYIGNAAATLGFTLSVFLNIVYLEGSQTCIFFLSPLLLLLQHDNYLFSNLTVSNRYYPIIAATSLFLGFSSIYSLFIQQVLNWANVPILVSSPLGSMSILKNGVLLLMTLPTHLLFNIFVYNFGKAGSQLVWLVITPLNILSAIFADIGAIKMLGAMGLIGGGLQFVITQKIQDYGKEIL